VSTFRCYPVRILTVPTSLERDMYEGKIRQQLANHYLWRFRDSANVGKKVGEEGIEPPTNRSQTCYHTILGNWQKLLFLARPPAHGTVSQEQEEKFSQPNKFYPNSPNNLTERHKIDFQRSHEVML